MGTENSARSGTGDDLVHPVVVDVTAGHVDTPFVGAVGEETDRTHRRTVGSEGADVGTIHRTGASAGEYPVAAGTVEIAAGHVDAVLIGAVGRPLRLRGGEGHEVPDPDQRRVGCHRSRPGHQGADPAATGADAVERHCPGVQRVEPVLQTVGGSGPVPGPGKGAEHVREVIAAGCRATVKLTNVVVVLVIERRTGGAAFGGTGIIVVDPDHSPAGGAGGGIVFEADPLLLGVRMVDANRRCGLGARTVPSGPENVPLGVGRVIELNQAEVGTRSIGPFGGTALGHGQVAVTLLAAFGAPWFTAPAVLIVPVDPQSALVAAGHPAVIGGDEVGGEIVGRVVDHRPGADPEPPELEDAHRLDLIGPEVAFGADHVDVARLGPPAVRRFTEETAIAVVHGGEQHFQLLHAGHRHRDLHNQFVPRQDSGPVFAVLPVVFHGERAVSVRVVRSVKEHLPALGHHPAPEAEVQRLGPAGNHMQPPHHPLAGEGLPGAAVGGGEQHFHRHGKSPRLIELVGDFVFHADRYHVHLGHGQFVNGAQRLNRLPLRRGPDLRIKGFGKCRYRGEGQKPQSQNSHTAGNEPVHCATHDLLHRIYSLRLPF